MQVFAARYIGLEGMARTSTFICYRSLRTLSFELGHSFFRTYTCAAYCSTVAGFFLFHASPLASFSHGFRRISSAKSGDRVGGYVGELLLQGNTCYTDFNSDHEIWESPHFACKLNGQSCLLDVGSCKFFNYLAPNDSMSQRLLQ